MVSHRLVGSITRSVGPAVTLGALTFSASSDRQLRQLVGPVPHVVAGQRFPAAAHRRRQRAHRVEAAAAGSTVTASNGGCIRTRCWVIEEPKVSA